MLFLARVGVGVGEAGCSPAAYSLLSAIYPPERRARAMAIYGAGIPLGGALGLALGGTFAQFYGWRATFFLFGIPSALAALLALVFLHEPARGAEPAARRQPIRDVVSHLWARHAFRHATFATALLAFAGFGSGAWMPSFLVRSHGMPISWVGLALASVTIIAAVPATILAGPIADRFARRDVRFLMRLPAMTMTCAAPLSLLALLLPAGTFDILGLSVPAFVFVVALMAIPTAATALYVGPVLAAIQGMVPEGMRATTVAIFLFVTNLIGLGAGPFVIGFLSDVLRTATGAQSLRWSLLVTVFINLWAAFHFWRGSAHLPRDLEPGVAAYA
jgi:MFS family permease